MVFVIIIYIQHNIVKKLLDSNLFFGLMAIALVAVIAANLWSISAIAAGGETSSGTQIGGIVLAVSAAGCQLPPPAGSGPDPICTAVGCTPNPANNGVQIMPYGYSATGICPTIAEQTNMGPISISSVGNQILGLYATPAIPGPSIPLLITQMSPAS